MLRIFLLTSMLVATCGAAAEAAGHAPDGNAVRHAAATLSLTDLDVHPDDKGSDAVGTLPGGARVELDVHRDGSIDKVEAVGHRTAPLSELMPVLPAGLSAPKLTPKSRIFKIELDDDHIEVEGRDDNGQKFKAEFTASGHLLEWKRD
ncbi:UNVERIFIED_ORG: hypothetical protein BCL66_11035 [Martelella mediterranea]|uniref:hypothetical protein n=1 Tax=unclassified Martelella TaxID=2629616 RepID=UPI000D08474F|nr:MULTISPECIES: hypothetical protein [unclassified Martelella]